MNDLRSQLGPQWTPVNLVITLVLLFLGLWPLSLAMVAYIVWGAKIGLDLRQPSSFSGLFTRIGGAFTGAKDGFLKQGSSENASADHTSWNQGQNSGKPNHPVDSADDSSPDGRAHRWPPRQGDEDIETSTAEPVETTDTNRSN